MKFALTRMLRDRTLEFDNSKLSQSRDPVNTVQDLKAGPSAAGTHDLQHCQELVHLSGGVSVAGPNRDGDACSQQRLSLFNFTQASEQLRELKIAGHVIGMVRQQLVEVSLSRVRVAIRGTAHRQAVSQK